MSQMSRLRMKVEMNNANTLTTAIKQLEVQYPGIRCEMDGKNVIVRYVGIEQYKRNGNLRFQWKGAKFEAIGDHYNTNGKLEEVMKAIEIMYRRAGVEIVTSNMGSIVKENIQGGMRIRLHTRR